MQTETDRQTDGQTGATRKLSGPVDGVVVLDLTRPHTTN